MSTVVIVFLFFLVSNISSQIIPLRFALSIDELTQQQQQQHYTSFDMKNHVDYNLTPEQMLERMSLLLSNNETNACDQDFKIILQAALKREMWAMKIFDAWGKPLPSGVLSGNVYWVGDYDECLQEMYIPNNKSFVSQPFNAQYCKYIYFNIGL
jgi:hypothetical protein